MAGTAGVFLRLDTVLFRVRDIGQAMAWYREKLGFAEPYFDAAERLAVFDLGGATSLTIWELQEEPEGQPEQRFTPFPIFAVEDARTTRQLLLERGVPVGEVIEGPGVLYFTFRDPDGNLLEACQVL